MDSPLKNHVVEGGGSPSAWQERNRDSPETKTAFVGLTLRTGISGPSKGSRRGKIRCRKWNGLLLGKTLKEIVQAKMKMCSTQVIQDVDEFVSSSELEKCSIPSLAQQWILCSEWVPSEWESKQLIKHHNNPQVIHTTPVHQLMSCEAKSCVFVNKSIKTFLTSNYCFWPKYEFIIHNNFSSSEKVHLLLSSNIKIHPHICLKLFWTVLACKRCLICADISPDSDQTTFSLEETILWTHILAGSDGLKLKTSRWICFLQTHCFSPSQDVNWWTGVVWMKQHLWIIVMFLSAVWTLILSWASDGMQLECISPNLFPWRNKLIYILDGLRLSTFSANLNFLPELFL